MQAYVCKFCAFIFVFILVLFSFNITFRFIRQTFKTLWLLILDKYTYTTMAHRGNSWWTICTILMECIYCIYMRIQCTLFIHQHLETIYIGHDSWILIHHIVCEEVDRYLHLLICRYKVNWQKKTCSDFFHILLIVCYLLFIRSCPGRMSG